MTKENQNQDRHIFDELNKAELLQIIDDFAKNWLAHDGLWFQAIEKESGLAEAIKFDKEAWRLFSPIEAKRIKQRFDLPEKAGLEGLEKALGCRMYSRINEQIIGQKSTDPFVFKMKNCRVQAARIRKGMPLFPCKEVGIVEYEEFARAIDSRITTKCLTCPPDEYNGQYFCSWKFTLNDK